eukprot:c5490_g1_i3.p1 GENE.c5490_g1_i3~~c5490_g1_i3.p1  ORF type:complete len:223 (+),score=25.71 c5490_g1_i3:118-786(+)
MILRLITQTESIKSNSEPPPKFLSTFTCEMLDLFHRVHRPDADQLFLPSVARTTENSNAARRWITCVRYEISRFVRELLPRAIHLAIIPKRIFAIGTPSENETQLKIQLHPHQDMEVYLSNCLSVWCSIQECSRVNKADGGSKELWDVSPVELIAWYWIVDVLFIVHHHIRSTKGLGGELRELGGLCEKFRAIPSAHPNPNVSATLDVVTILVDGVKTALRT